MKRGVLGLFAALLLLAACQLLSHTPAGQIVAPLQAPSGTLWVDYIDVGQGDSTLIILPNRQSILIDCGRAGKGISVVADAKKRGLDHIDALLGTHADADHIGGCDEVMDQFPVTEVIENGQVKDTKAFADFEQRAQKRQDLVLLDDTDLSLDPSVGLRFMAAYPERGMDANTNTNSIALKLTYGNRALLFTGDCDEPCEQTLRDTEDVNVDVYKAGHHGSSSSSTDAFLSEVTPSAVVISVGAKNQYGHPSPIALKRISAYTDAVFRTDEHGTITLSTDGQEIKITDAKGLLWWKN